MADTPEQNEKAPAKKSKAAVYTLTKNFGYVENGAHRFLEKGTEFVESEDAAMISKLHRIGAPISLKK